MPAFVALIALMTPLHSAIISQPTHIGLFLSLALYLSISLSLSFVRRLINLHAADDITSLDRDDYESHNNKN